MLMEDLRNRFIFSLAMEYHPKIKDGKLHQCALRMVQSFSHGGGGLIAPKKTNSFVIIYLYQNMNIM
jgi:hypothetical protein